MIDALKKGDANAFQQVYQQYGDKVYRYFKKKTFCDEDAQDLVQTTFLKLWQYRRTLSHDFLLDQHLFHIAKTVFIDHLRKQNKKAHLQKQWLLQTEKEPHSNPATAYSVSSQLSEALLSMPETRRKVFELNRLQGYTYKEVALMLSISIKAVDNNLAKALKQLRLHMLISFLFLICLFF